MKTLALEEKTFGEFERKFDIAVRKKFFPAITMKTLIHNIIQRLAQAKKNFFASEIPADLRREFLNEITFQNLQRIRFLMLPVVLFFFYLLYVDLFEYTTGLWGQSNYREWFFMDLSFVVVGGGVLLLSQIKRAKNSNEITIFHTALTVIFTKFIFAWAVVGTALDQIGYGEITTYILVTFAVTATLVLNTKKRFFLYFLSHAAFFAAIYFFQENDRKLVAHTTNAIATIIVSWALSHLLYVNRVRSFLDKKTIESQKENMQKANSELNNVNMQLEASLEETNILLDQLTESNRTLEILNEEKNEFLGIAAHDLKNPLSGILLNAELVRNYAAKMSREEISSQMEKIETTARRMREIISNLLDVNALETGNFRFEKEKIPVHSLVQNLIEEYQTRAKEKNLQIHFFAESEEIFALTDRNALTEIFENLLSNAIKFSPYEKNIFVGIRQNNDENICIEIQDEGPGLTKDDQEKLFTKYAKLSAKPTAGEHSTGLGLSIVKKMAEALDGKIFCESETGHGAKFIVELPSAEKSIPA